MKKIKLLLVMSLIFVLCCSCGTKDTARAAIPDSASEIITDIFVDISFDEEIPVVSMYDCSDDIISGLLTYMYIVVDANEVIDDCLIYIYTPEEVVETSLEEQMQILEIKDAKMPEKYMTYIKNNDLDKKGISVEKGTVDEETVTRIKENIQLYVVDVLKEKCGEKLTEENVETEIPQNEDEREIIKNEVYEAEEVEVTMTLSQDIENDYHLSIWISSEVEWKLAYSYIICKNMMLVDSIMKLNPVVLATNEEVMLTSLGASFANETIIDASEWCVDKMLTGGYDAEAAELLTDELQNMMFDFLELK